MADFRKHFEYDELAEVTGEIWTTRNIAILIVCTANENDILSVKNFDLQGRQWGEHPVTAELETAIRHQMERANDSVMKLQTDPFHNKPIPT